MSEAAKRAGGKRHLRIPLTVTAHPDVSPRAANLYGVLQRYMGDKGCFPSTQTLCREARCAPDTLYCHLDELIGAGFVRRHSGGGRDSNHYELFAEGDAPPLSLTENEKLALRKANRLALRQAKTEAFRARKAAFRSDGNEPRGYNQSARGTSREASTIPASRDAAGRRGSAAACCEPRSDHLQELAPDGGPRPTKTAIDSVEWLAEQGWLRLSEDGERWHQARLFDQLMEVLSGGVGTAAGWLLKARAVEGPAYTLDLTKELASARRLLSQDASERAPAAASGERRR